MEGRVGHELQSGMREGHRDGCTQKVHLQPNFESLAKTSIQRDRNIPGNRRGSGVQPSHQRTEAKDP